MKKFTDEEIQKFVKQYNEGITISKIAKENNCSYPVIHRCIKPYVNFPIHQYKFSKEDEEKIIHLYTEENLSTVKIGKLYKVSYRTIARLLERNRINRTGVGRRKYSLDETYFENIDTPNKAYILGFLYADGSNNKSKQTVSMSLQEEDKYILEKIRQEVKSEKELEFIDYSDKHDFGYTYKNQYRLLFFSKHISESLESIGMVPNKSLVLEFPDIDSKFYPHFIRGYFDGDGSFCPNYSKAGKFQPLITFTSTNNFCVKLQEILTNELNIAGGNIYDAACHNGITKVLSISGAVQTKKILDWMYNDAEMYLERKYIKYRNAFDNYIAA